MPFIIGCFLMLALLVWAIGFSGIFFFLGLWLLVGIINLLLGGK